MTGHHFMWPWEYTGKWPFEFRNEEKLMSEGNGSFMWWFSCPIFEIWKWRQ